MPWIVEVNPWPIDFLVATPRHAVHSRQWVTQETPIGAGRQLREYIDPQGRRP